MGNKQPITLRMIGISILLIVLVSTMPKKMATVIILACLVIAYIIVRVQNRRSP